MTTTLFIILFQKMFNKQSILFKIVIEFFSVFLTLVLIYYASKSFNFKPTSELQNNSSLFTFLLLGEIALIIPMSAAERWLNNFSNLRNQQFYQTLLGLRISPLRYLLSQVIIDLFFPFMRVLFIILGGYLLNTLPIGITNIFYFLCLQFFSVLIFLLMAILASFFYLKFNRGISFFYTLQTISTILGGAYFPISVFPNSIKNLSILLPQTQILALSRMIFSTTSDPLNGSLLLLAWLVFFTILAISLNNYMVRSLKENARFF